MSHDSLFIMLQKQMKLYVVLKDSDLGDKILKKRKEIVNIDI